MSPGLLHERRRHLLDDMASLMAFPPATDPMLALPDGSIPDVLRIDIYRRRLFIGDAKDVETPGNTATRRRLSHYVLWACAATRKGFDVVVAICHGRQWEALDWARTLNTLARSAGVEVDVRVLPLDADCLITSFRLAPTGPGKAMPAFLAKGTPAN
jgi:hypothetical protein